MQAQSGAWDFVQEERSSGLELVDGSRIAIVGAGPAGSFFAYFLLDLAARLDRELDVTIYEPRDFSHAGPKGCNMCGGIISESLVQHLAVDGITLPETIVQRGIDSYVLHMDVGSVTIATPLNEKRIGTVYRGPGPRGIQEIRWGSFDGHLLQLACQKGAKVIHERVTGVRREGDQVWIRAGGEETAGYDLLAVSIGVNSTATARLVKDLDLTYRPPETTKTLIREYYLGEETIAQVLGSSMHVFLLDIPGLEFAAAIPKGDYVSICLLGQEIDRDLYEAFLDAPEVKRCMPEGWSGDQHSCQCLPRINVRGATQPFDDRVVFVGDSGVTRLYKDGIGAAYRTAKAAASTAIFQGISAEAFRDHFWPQCQAIERDNSIGKVMFKAAELMQKSRVARHAVLRTTMSEQANAAGEKRMSTVLWDMFTGSASYREILTRTCHPAFLARFLQQLTVSVLTGAGASGPLESI